jgi:hypothetical protein
MKLFLTEAEYKKMTEDNLRHFLFSFWDNQKKQGMEPVLDDIIYHVIDIRKDSNDENYFPIKDPGHPGSFLIFGLCHQFPITPPKDSRSSKKSWNS